MKQKTCTDQTFRNIDFTQNKTDFQEFDSCQFIGCNFSGLNLYSKEFMDCSFTDCDLSNVKFANAQLKDVRFIGSKLMGADFSECSDFLLAFSFEKCNLDYATFHHKKMQKTFFKECSLKEVDFSLTDLTGSVFNDCDLSRSLFQKSNLTGVDFRTALNYYFDLDMNKVKKARFSASGVIKLLDKYRIIVD